MFADLLLSCTVWCFLPLLVLMLHFSGSTIHSSGPILKAIHICLCSGMGFFEKFVNKFWNGTSVWTSCDYVSTRTVMYFAILIVACSLWNSLGVALDNILYTWISEPLLVENWCQMFRYYFSSMGNILRIHLSTYLVLKKTLTAMFKTVPFLISIVPDA